MTPELGHVRRGGKRREERRSRGQEANKRTGCSQMARLEPQGKGNPAPGLESTAYGGRVRQPWPVTGRK